MESNEQREMEVAHEMAISLVETINQVRQVISLKYELDEPSARRAMVKALVQNAVSEVVQEPSLGFDERCDLEDSIYRAILIASSGELDASSTNGKSCQFHTSHCGRAT